MFLRQIEAYLQHKLTEDQENLTKLLSNFLFHSPDIKIFIINGYAGTGKTSLVSALIQTLPYYNLKTTLLAPTGRAAKVLGNHSNRSASTIHKHIYYTSGDPNGITTLKLKQNKTSDTIYITDEASMIGESESLFAGRSLLQDLINYATSGRGNKIIFIGDTAQLPPINNPYSPALNPHYIETNFHVNVAYYQLTQVVRQALTSGILKNASNIRWALARNRIKLPIFKIKNHPDIKRLDTYDMEETLLGEYRLHGVNDVVIITRTNRLANMINQYVRTRILEKENRIDIGETLMSVKNNYHWTGKAERADFIANGDMLQITHIYRYEEAYGLNFADIAVKFADYPEQEEIELTIILDTLFDNQASLSADKQQQLYNQLYTHYSQDTRNKALIQHNIKQDKHYNALQVKFANALTCHKAQGGDWHSVFIQQGLFNTEMFDQDYLRWLYTAVTRARKQLYLINFSEDFFFPDE